MYSDINVPSYVEHEGAYVAAAKARIVSNARKTFFKTYPRAEEVADFLNLAVGKSEFLLSVRGSFERYGKLSPKQYEAVCNCIDKAAERKALKADKIAQEKAELAATSNYVGEVGKRIEIKVKLVARIEFQGASFSYYDSGISYINLLDDEAGNRIVYFGRSLYHVEKNQFFTLKANVKAHEVRDGVKQTVVNRPKVIEGETPQEDQNA